MGWFHSGQPPLPVRLVRDPHGQCDPQALPRTGPARAPHDIIGWFVHRWLVEATFRELRNHLGVGTRRRWPNQAVACATPCRLGLFSIAHPLGGLGHRLVPQTASNLRRYPRRRAPAGLDRSGFCDVPCLGRREETPAPDPPGNHLPLCQAVLRYVKWLKPKVLRCCDCAGMLGNPVPARCDAGR